jgi:acetyl esterase/lipase
VRAQRLICLALTVSLASAAGVGVASARPYSQQNPPSGPYAGAPPRGYVLLVHGGGWKLVGSGMAGLMNPTADRLNRAGYATLNVDYRAGSRSLHDVLGFYDELRARVGPRAEICIYGDSAGGNLALLVAQRRPDVACVIAEAAPTDLAALPHGPGDLGRTARRLFKGALRAWSPAARPLKQPALLAYGRRDSVVPYDQGRRMLRRAPRATLTGMRPGRAAWVHGRVAARDLRHLYAAQLSLLRSSR